MMETGAIISLLCGVIATLSGVIVWLVKTERKERKAVLEACSQMLMMCKQSLDENTKATEKVIGLLTNWRGH